jgi:hypothetical protein
MGGDGGWGGNSYGIYLAGAGTSPDAPPKTASLVTGTGEVVEFNSIYDVTAGSGAMAGANGNGGSGGAGGTGSDGLFIPGDPEPELIPPGNGGPGGKGGAGGGSGSQYAGSGGEAYGILVDATIPGSLDGNTIILITAGAGNDASAGGLGGPGGIGGPGGNAYGLPLTGGNGGGGGLGGNGGSAGQGSPGGKAAGIMAMDTGSEVTWAITNNDVFTVVGSLAGNGGVGGTGGAGGAGGPPGVGGLGPGTPGAGGNGGDGGYGSGGADANPAFLVEVNGNASVDVINNTLLDVVASAAGGTPGMHGAGGAPGMGVPPGLPGNMPLTVLGPGSGTWAYGMEARFLSLVNLYNNIIMERFTVIPTNSAGVAQYLGATITADYNDVYRWAWMGNLGASYGASNISIDPLFETGSHKLQSTSPCRDTGDDSAPSGPDRDHEYIPRPIHITDMGAYEYALQGFLPLIKKP